MAHQFKRRVFEVLELEANATPLGRAVAVGMTFLIAVNVAAVVLETMPQLEEAYAVPFRILDWVSVAVFALEYVLRIWSCTSDSRYASPFAGRVRFAVTPLAIIDLLAIAPALLPFIVGVDLRFLRLFRLLRLFKLTRYSDSLQLLVRVVNGKKHEIGLSLFLVILLLVFSSSVMYQLEHEVQPDKFASIPDAMWWGIVTLATVGYGDVFPITPLGKIFGGFIVVLGVGVVALPAAILASGFMAEAERKEREAARKEAPCPHCGKHRTEPVEPLVRAR